MSQANQRASCQVKAVDNGSCVQDELAVGGQHAVVDDAHHAAPVHRRQQLLERVEAHCRCVAGLDLDLQHLSRTHVQSCLWCGTFELNSVTFSMSR